jgi:hypothetical protein
MVNDPLFVIPTERSERRNPSPLIVFLTSTARPACLPAGRDFSASPEMTKKVFDGFHLSLLFLWQCEIECRPLPRFTLDPDPAAVALDNPLANGESHARSRIFFPLV